MKNRKIGLLLRFASTQSRASAQDREGPGVLVVRQHRLAREQQVEHDGDGHAPGPRHPARHADAAGGPRGRGLRGHRLG